MKPVKVARQLKSIQSSPNVLKGLQNPSQVTTQVTKGLQNRPQIGAPSATRRTQRQASKHRVPEVGGRRGSLFNIHCIGRLACVVMQLAWCWQACSLAGLVCCAVLVVLAVLSCAVLACLLACLLASAIAGVIAACVCLCLCSGCLLP